MNLQGEQIPKATMTSYLKEKLGKTKISTEFTEGILHIAKEYVTRIANKANEICTSEKKKTISLDHLYKSIEFFQLQDQMDSLKKVELEVKNDVMAKNEMKLQIQRSYDEMVRERQDNQEKGLQPSVSAPLKEAFSNRLQQQSDGQDYEQEDEQPDEQQDDEVPKN